MFGLLRMPRFIRRYIRRRTAAMPYEKALKTREKLSLAYAFVAWNLFGGVAYFTFSGRWKEVKDETYSGLSQGLQFVKMLKMENVQLYRVQGVSSIEGIDLNQHYSLKSETIEETDKETQL